MSTADTKHRLDEIEKQLANLVEEQTVIKAKWDSEKQLIQSSRTLKSQIEELRVQAEEFERFLGEKSKELEDRLEEAKDVMKRLKERE